MLAILQRSKRVLSTQKLFVSSMGSPLQIARSFEKVSKMQWIWLNSRADMSLHVEASH